MFFLRLYTGMWRSGLRKAAAARFDEAVDASYNEDAARGSLGGK